jgi:hypothetical protein
MRFHILIPHEILRVSHSLKPEIVTRFRLFHLSRFTLRTGIVIEPFVHNLAILPPRHRNLMNGLPVGRDEIHSALVEGHIVANAVGRDRESLPLIICPFETG